MGGGKAAVTRRSGGYAGRGGVTACSWVTGGGPPGADGGTKDKGQERCLENWTLKRGRGRGESQSPGSKAASECGRQPAPGHRSLVRATAARSRGDGGQQAGRGGGPVQQGQSAWRTEAGRAPRGQPLWMGTLRAGAAPLCPQRHQPGRVSLGNQAPPQTDHQPRRWGWTAPSPGPPVGSGMPVDSAAGLWLAPATEGGRDQNAPVTRTPLSVPGGRARPSRTLPTRGRADTRACILPFPPRATPH